jgi:Fe-S cluster assembly iron-binding protein IscA
MAEGGNLADAFKRFATKADGKEATTADVRKWCKDAGVFGKKCTENHVDISFSKAKQQKSKNITCNDLEKLIAEMAKNYMDDHKMDLDQAKEEIKEKLANAQPKAHGTTKTLKSTGGVDRLTDTKGYTGSHKERFDDSGKGKGIAGRKETADGSGYVGAYKGAGTYDKKK